MSTSCSVRAPPAGGPEAAAASPARARRRCRLRRSGPARSFSASAYGHAIRRGARGCTDAASVAVCSRSSTWSYWPALKGAPPRPAVSSRPGSAPDEDVVMAISSARRQRRTLPRQHRGMAVSRDRAASVFMVSVVYSTCQSAQEYSLCSACFSPDPPAKQQAEEGPIAAAGNALAQAAPFTSSPTTAT